MKPHALRAQFNSIRSRLTWRQFATPINRLMCLTLAVLVPVEILLARVVHLTGLAQLLDIWPAMLFLFVCLLYCVLRPLPRLIEGCELTIWTITYTSVLSLLIQIAGRSPRPLIDPTLNAMDARMHFSTAFIVHLIAQFPVAQIILAIAYSLTPPFIIAAVLVPPFMGRPRASRRYVVGILLAAMITAALSALWPAVGPWTMQNLIPTKSQTGITAYLMHLKSNLPVNLDMDNAAIVSCPSFHVVLAILSATALSSIPRLRGWVWVLAGLICVSTITTGWHYGIDVIGGLIVAILSIAIVKRIEGKCF